MLETRLGTDLVVHDAAGRPVVAVELKNARDLSRDVAIQFRRNLLTHNALPRLPYFLLLSPQHGYLWRQGPETPDDWEESPSRVFPMDGVIARRSPGVDRSTRLGGAEFAAIVFGWLQMLAWRATSSSDQSEEDPAEEALRASGLLDAIRGGAVAHQTPV